MIILDEIRECLDDKDYLTAGLGILVGPIVLIVLAIVGGPAWLTGRLAAAIVKRRP